MPDDARHSILKSRSSSGEYRLSSHSPTVLRVLSLRPLDPYKSPLYPPVQGLRAATHRLCLHLCKLPDHQPLCLRQPTYWTHFYILGITNPPPDPRFARSRWTQICIFSHLLRSPPGQLNAFFSFVIRHDSEPHLYLKICSPTTLCLFIYPLKKLNYEWMSHWIIHVHPSAANK